MPLITDSSHLHKGNLFVCTSESKIFADSSHEEKIIISYQIMSFVKYDNIPLEFNAMSFPWLKKKER